MEYLQLHGGDPIDRTSHRGRGKKSRRSVVHVERMTWWEAVDKITKKRRLECGGAHMYDEVENASDCLVPGIHGSIKFSLVCVGPSTVEILEGRFDKGCRHR